jgi:hypothetical protein
MKRALVVVALAAVAVVSVLVERGDAGMAVARLTVKGMVCQS